MINIINYFKQLFSKNKPTFAQMITDTPNDNGDYTFIKDST